MIDALREGIQARVNRDYDILTRRHMFSMGSRLSSNMLFPTTSSPNSDETSIDSMCEDDRLAYHIYKIQTRFQDDLSKGFSDFRSVNYYKFVIQAIDDAAGVSLPNFPSYQIIQRLFPADLMRLPKICFSMVEQICD